jgi:hypothetical protein
MHAEKAKNLIASAIRRGFAHPKIVDCFSIVRAILQRCKSSGNWERTVIFCNYHSTVDCVYRALRNGVNGLSKEFNCKVEFVVGDNSGKFSGSNRHINSVVSKFGIPLQKNTNMPRHKKDAWWRFASEEMRRTRWGREGCDDEGEMDDEKVKEARQ